MTETEHLPLTTAEPQTEQPKQKTAAEIAAGFGITEARYLAMVQYARVLRKMNPKMKESSVRSKVAQKYKIKLV